MDKTVIGPFSPEYSETALSAVCAITGDEPRGTYRFDVHYGEPGPDGKGNECLDFVPGMTETEARANAANWQALKRTWWPRATVEWQRVA